jgi:hypothetical protein
MGRRQEDEQTRCPIMRSFYALFVKRAHKSKMLVRI